MSKEGIIIGYHAVEELLQSGVTIGKVYINEKPIGTKLALFDF